MKNNRCGGTKWRDLVKIPVYEGFLQFLVTGETVRQTMQRQRDKHPAKLSQYSLQQAVSRHADLKY